MLVDGNEVVLALGSAYSCVSADSSANTSTDAASRAVVFAKLFSRALSLLKGSYPRSSGSFLKVVRILLAYLISQNGDLISGVDIWIPIQLTMGRSFASSIAIYARQERVCIAKSKSWSHKGPSSDVLWSK